MSGFLLWLLRPTINAILDERRDRHNLQCPALTSETVERITRPVPRRDDLVAAGS